MTIRGTRSCTLLLAAFVVLGWMRVGAQTKPNPQPPPQPANPQQDSRQAPAVPGADYSGMYSFLRDGEFLQITVEDHGRVIGFISRYADSEGDSGFLEHFLKGGKLDGNQLVFATETVKDVSFEFRGTVQRGEGKSRADEAYYVLKGTLVENTTDKAKKTTSKSQDVVLTSFPPNMSPPPPEQK